ncbi:MAG: hypothetical protein E7544_00805 [Ruminococcaceae bacterium]|nr:hypothetical protein [Oscillospiraceae bacterium]
MILKPKLTKTIVGLAFAFLGIVGIILNYFIFEDRDNQFASILCILIGGLFAVYGYHEYTTNHLAFTPSHFEVRGQTYSYSQIERLETKIRKRMTYYSICVNGVAIFTFERDYENAKEFFETLERNGVSLSPIQ